MPGPERERIDARRAIVAANGAFLALVGGAQVVFELLSHFAGAGPLGDRFTGSPYTIGFVEAHGLALVFGIWMLRVARSTPAREWHATAVGIHVLLGGANLLFWDAFVTMDLAPAGVVATLFHGAFVLAQSWCYARAPRIAPERATPG